MSVFHVPCVPASAEARAARALERLCEQVDAFRTPPLAGDSFERVERELHERFRLAAEQGYAPAQSAVGFMYVHGEGVPEDAVTAYAWFSIAAAQGNPIAHFGKEHMTGLMTRAQIAEAQKRSGVYWTRYVVPFQ